MAEGMAENGDLVTQLRELLQQRAASGNAPPRAFSEVLTVPVDEMLASVRAKLGWGTKEDLKKLTSLEDGTVITFKGDDMILTRPAATSPAAKPAMTAVAPVAAAPPAVAADQTKRQTLEEECASVWNADADVRTEFGGEFTRYLAFRKAEAAGRVGRLTGSRFGQDAAVAGASDACPFFDRLGVEAAAKQEWGSNPALRAEFGTLERYQAWRIAEARGQVNSGAVAHSEQVHHEREKQRDASRRVYDGR
ncbi:MAG TPA: hypothetical protein VNK82_07225 [Terriglobales bacterium]|nr:hypothetical protein [Terriglobales bacterium]